MGPLLTILLSCATVRDTVTAAHKAHGRGIVGQQAYEVKPSPYWAGHKTEGVALYFATGPYASVIHTLTFVHDSGLTSIGLRGRQGSCLAADGSLVRYFTTVRGLK
jgi:hypothetical protein